jgi:multidrug efflux pump subunit AcrB
VQPDRLDETAIKWDGEWQITIEVFRDLGLAFAAVLLLIYVLVVWWFESFSIPLVIMAPIPLTLIGILPGHALTGAFFTATSMIGMIALAGIIVRNSILLVDFIRLAEERGVPLRQAVIEAGAVRFRPIALTAAAVVVGGLVMVLDPIFQGLAVALMSGAIVATAAHDGGRAPFVLGAAAARVVGFFNLERFICATRWSFAELPAHSFWALSPSGGG